MKTLYNQYVSSEAIKHYAINSKNENSKSFYISGGYLFIYTVLFH